MTECYTAMKRMGQMRGGGRGNVQDVGLTEKKQGREVYKYGSMLNIYILLKLYTFRSAHFTVGKL